MIVWGMRIPGMPPPGHARRVAHGCLTSGLDRQRRPTPVCLLEGCLQQVVGRTVFSRSPSFAGYSLESPCSRGTGHGGGRETEESSVNSESMGQCALRVVSYVLVSTSVATCVDFRGTEADRSGQLSRAARLWDG
jgi:hypothetical protein